MLLGSMSLISCPTETPPPEEKKTVAEKFWGVYEKQDGATLTISEDSVKWQSTGGVPSSHTAWSEDNILFIDSKIEGIPEYTLEEEWEGKQEGETKRLNPAKGNAVGWDDLFYFKEVLSH